MQAIVTKILPATNTKPTRIKATCARGSLTISQPIHHSVEESHRIAVLFLVQGFAADDRKKYGSADAGKNWLAPFITGCLPNGDFCHVFKGAK